MSNRWINRITAFSLALLLAAALTLPATAQEGRNQTARSRTIKQYTFQLAVTAPGDGPGRTLRTIELGCIEREKISFHYGTKAPIPTTTFNPAEGMDASGKAIPRISYSYQNLGLQFELQVLQKADDLVFVGLEYNLSFIDPDAGKRKDGDPPLILSHEMERIKGLKPGTPVVVAEFFRPAEGQVLAQSLGIDQGAMGNTGPWRLLLTLVPEQK